MIVNKLPPKSIIINVLGRKRRWGGVVEKMIFKGRLDGWGKRAPG